MFWTTVPDLAREGHLSADTLYELAKREDDPFPLRYLPGCRYGQVSVSEAEEWFRRNGTLMRDRRKDG